MTFKTYEINVDLVHDTSTTYSNHFSQNDRNSAKLLVTITNKGAELDLSQAKSVRMSFRKPDGTRVFQNDCQPINAMKGKYQIVLKTQTLTSVGNVIAQIHIEEDDRILDTQKFFFVVNDSLASDEAVESTNEFTIIQKAIEAGKKLEGVDINGIIAAGAKADAALPKSGGTMTGVLTLGNELRFEGASSVQQMVFKGDGKTTKSVWLAKSQEGIVVIPETAPGSGSRDWANAVYLGGNQNGLVKKTGDTMTGTFVLSSANAEINFKDEKSEVAIQKTSAGNIAMWDRKNQKTVWLYVPESNEFRLQAAKTNIVTKDKDTRALITVTADAELTTSDGVIADRRGNTVTLRARVRRKNEQINTVFMMPEGMKPLLTVAHNIIANDGTVGALSIGTSGDVKISSVGPSLVNKDFNFTISYVVD
ncbi:TPA: BppU family phage baseplate upper protein [Bacillus pacificus]